MKIKRIISDSNDGKKMEVICDDGKTRHLHKVKDGWSYLSHFIGKPGLPKTPVFRIIKES